MTEDIYTQMSRFLDGTKKYLKQLTSQENVKEENDDKEDKEDEDEEENAMFIPQKHLVFFEYIILEKPEIMKVMMKIYEKLEQKNKNNKKDRIKELTIAYAKILEDMIK